MSTMVLYCYQKYHMYFSAQMFAPPSVYSRVRRANGTRAGPPGPYICALLAVFAVKHEAINSANGEHPIILVK